MALRARALGPRCDRRCRDANGVPRVFLVEIDYERAIVDADFAFTEQLAADIESGSLDGVTFWNDLHERKGDA